MFINTLFSLSTVMLLLIYNSKEHEVTERNYDYEDVSKEISSSTRAGRGAAGSIIKKYLEPKEKLFVKPKSAHVPILKQINRYNEDGSYTYGFEGGDGTFKMETKYSTGEVYGKYGYIDDTGKLRMIEYGADKRGFRPYGEGITIPLNTINNHDSEENDDKEDYLTQQTKNDVYKSKFKNQEVLKRHQSSYNDEYDYGNESSTLEDTSEFTSTSDNNTSEMKLPDNNTLELKSPDNSTLELSSPDNNTVIAYDNYVQHVPMIFVYPNLPPNHNIPFQTYMYPNLNTPYVQHPLTHTLYMTPINLINELGEENTTQTNQNDTLT